MSNPYRGGAGFSRNTEGTLCRDKVAGSICSRLKHSKICVEDHGSDLKIGVAFPFGRYERPALPRERHRLDARRVGPPALRKRSPSFSSESASADSLFVGSRKLLGSHGSGATWARRLSVAARLRAFLGRHRLSEQARLLDSVGDPHCSRPIYGRRIGYQSRPRYEPSTPGASAPRTRISIDGWVRDEGSTSVAPSTQRKTPEPSPSDQQQPRRKAGRPLLLKRCLISA